MYYYSDQSHEICRKVPQSLSETTLIVLYPGGEGGSRGGLFNNLETLDYSCIMVSFPPGGGGGGVGLQYKNAWICV